MQDLYIENYKTLLKEIKEVINKWKVIPCSWIGRLHIAQMKISPKLTGRFNVNLILTPSWGFLFFFRNDKLILKVMWKYKGYRISKIILRKV